MSFKRWPGKGSNSHTVHANGSVFQLKMMKKSSSSREVRPGPVKKDCTKAGQLMRQAAYPIDPTATEMMGIVMANPPILVDDMARS